MVYRLVAVVLLTVIRQETRFRGYSLMLIVLDFKSDDSWETLWSGHMSSRAVIKNVLLQETDQQNQQNKD